MSNGEGKLSEKSCFPILIIQRVVDVKWSGRISFRICASLDKRNEDFLSIAVKHLIPGGVFVFGPSKMWMWELQSLIPAHEPL